MATKRSAADSTSAANSITTPRKGDKSKRGKDTEGTKTNRRRSSNKQAQQIVTTESSANDAGTQPTLGRTRSKTNANRVTPGGNEGPAPPDKPSTRPQRSPNSKKKKKRMSKKEKEREKIRQRLEAVVNATSEEEEDQHTKPPPQDPAEKEEVISINSDADQDAKNDDDEIRKAEEAIQKLEKQLQERKQIQLLEEQLRRAKEKAENDSLDSSDDMVPPDEDFLDSNDGNPPHNDEGFEYEEDDPEDPPSNQVTVPFAVDENGLPDLINKDEYVSSESESDSDDESDESSLSDPEGDTDPPLIHQPEQQMDFEIDETEDPTEQYTSVNHADSSITDPSPSSIPVIKQQKDIRYGGWLEIAECKKPFKDANRLLRAALAAIQTTLGKAIHWGPWDPEQEEVFKPWKTPDDIPSGEVKNREHFSNMLGCDFFNPKANKSSKTFVNVRLIISGKKKPSVEPRQFGQELSDVLEDILGPGSFSLMRNPIPCQATNSNIFYSTMTLLWNTKNLQQF